MSLLALTLAYIRARALNAVLNLILLALGVSTIVLLLLGGDKPWLALLLLVPLVGLPAWTVIGCYRVERSNGAGGDLDQSSVLAVWAGSSGRRVG